MSYSNIKLIIMLTMYIGSIGAIASVQSLNYVSAISFIIYAFLIAINFDHHTNSKKYISNIFKFALISELFFDLFMFYTHHPIFLSFLDYIEIDLFNKQNVMFTFGFGAISCYYYNLYKTKKENSYLILVISTILIPSLIRSQYGFVGALLVLLFYIYKNPYQRVLICSLFSFFEYEFLTFQLYALFIFVCGVILYSYNGNRVDNILSNSKFYAFYPGHMLFLCILYSIIH